MANLNKAVVSLFALLSLVDLSTLPAQETSHIQFDARVAIRNHPARGWLPIVATIENAGEDDSFDTDLVAAARSSGSGIVAATRRISVAAKSKKRFYLYLNVQSRMVSAVDVSLQRNGEDLPGMRKKLPLSFRYDSVLIGVLSDALTVPNVPADTDVNRQKGLRVEATPLEIDSLPDSWLGYSAVDLLIINDLPLDKLTENQKRAITDWIKSGGRAVISSGEQSWLRSDFIQNLVPMEVIDVGVPEQTTAIEKRFGRFGYGRPSFQKVRILSDSWQRIVDEEIVKCRSGFGTVIFLAFDIRENPFPGWSGASKMWREIFRQFKLQPESNYGRFGRQATYRDSLWDGADTDRYGRFVVNPIHTIQRRQVSKLPSMGVVIIVVALYLIAVGPANYLLLRKLDRSIYTVATIPCIAIVFIGLIFSIGYITKGVNTIYQKVSLIEVPLGADFGREMCYFSLFSAGSIGYDIAFDKHTAPDRVYESFSDQKGATMVVDQTDGMTIANHRLKMWSLGMFRARSIQQLGGPIEKQQGAIKNLSNYDLRDCLLIDGLNVYEIGALPRGGDPVRVTESMRSSTKTQSRLSLRSNDMILSSLQRWLGAEPSEFNRKIALTLYDRYKRFQRGPMLLAFLDDDPSAPKINRRVRKRKDLTIIAVYLGESALE